MTQAQLLQQLQATVLKTLAIIQAFSVIDRADFVPPDYQSEAYEDIALPLGFGSTISQPTTVAIMLELLKPQSGDCVLDIGSGSGWTTALLGHIVGKEEKVFGVELVPELVALGQKSIDRYHMPQVTIMQAKSDVLGLPEQGLFDKILVSAASTSLPQDLVDQLKIGGTLVIPINSSVFKIDKISTKKVQTHELPGFAFVPLRTNY
jgi:protein-L-isoaspartate(D-aspartate) O-methyltransferase